MNSKSGDARAAQPRAEQAGLNRGTNQSGVRLYNERLVLSIIRQHGAMPKADIARLTGLSPQTISIITNQLSDDGLLTRGTPQRGRIGQPSVPYSLDPNGAFTFGVKIGRRSLDIVLMDFTGRVVAKLHEAYRYPDPASILETVGRGIDELTFTLPRERRSRISGIGIACPFELWNWEIQIGAPRRVLDAWRTYDVKREVQRRTGLPTYFYNDATSACAAEIMLGNPSGRLDFLYIFIGSFIGGGLVLNGSLVPGRRGYAGAVGPMPMPVAPPGKGHEQLIKRASIYVLAERMEAAGLDPNRLWENPDDWGDVGGLLDPWIEEVAESLALTCIAAASVIDMEAVVVDGGFPVSVRKAIVERTNAAAQRYDWQGIAPFDIIEGSIGSDARAMGGACLPLLANFTQDREVLFKDIG